MKKIFVYIAAVLLSLLLVTPCSAQDITLQINHSTYTSDILDDSTLIKFRASYDELYGWVSGEKPVLRLGTQEGAETLLYGVGLGFQKDIFDNVRLNIDAGWFYPHVRTRKAFHMDGAWYAFSTGLGISLGDPHYYFWEHYSYKAHNGFGGSIGIEGEHDISSHLSVGLNIGFRYLKLYSHLKGWNGTFDPDVGFWEMLNYQNYNSIQGGIFFKYNF